MALVKCKECGAPVSRAAKSCPSCGHPISAASGTGGLGRGGALAVIIVGVIVYLAFKGGKQDGGTNIAADVTAQNTCKENWSICADNADFINNYSKMFDAKYACKIATNKRARFGDPEWSWVPFGKFRKGNDFPKTGVVKLVDDDVRIPNMFGAKLHGFVECWYDFKSESATIVDLSEQR